MYGPLSSFSPLPLPRSPLLKKKETQEEIQESQFSSMFKALALFGRKKISRPFKDYFAEWIQTLKNTLLPQLRHSMSFNSSSSALLSTHVEMLHHHFQSYYQSLDLAASDDITQLLFPEWRNSLEKPFLWLGDLHPYVFTNLLRSFLDDGDDEDVEEEDGDDDSESVVELGRSSEFFNRTWHVVMAWKSPPTNLMARIEQIERALRLMVPSLAARARNAQAGFIEKVGGEWGRCDGRNEGGVKSAVREAVTAAVDEMGSVFMDANRLRKSVLAEIINVTNVYQAALFLEGLSQLLVGFRDRELISEFNGCNCLSIDEPN